MDNQKERSGFNKWTKQKPEIPESELQKLWNLSETYKSGYQPDVEAGLSRLKLRMEADQPRVVPMVANRNRRKWLSIAAAIALLLVSGIAMLGLLKEKTQTIVNLQDAPKEVLLEDGTIVILNKNSRLQYPQSFAGALKRAVELEGEAYFKVHHNPAQPFIIKTEKTEVKVLGTSFNVRAYQDEPTTEVEVETGHVMLMITNADKKFDLRASEKAVFEHQKQVVVKEKVAALNAQAWRTKSLHFRKTPLKEVLTAVSRYFAVDISLEDKGMENCLFNSDFDNETLEVVLSTLKSALNVEILETKTNEVFLLRGGTCS